MPKTRRRIYPAALLSFISLLDGRTDGWTHLIDNGRAYGRTDERPTTARRLDLSCVCCTAAGTDMTHTRSGAGPDRHILDPALLSLLGYSPCNPFNSSYRLSIRQVCACAVATPLPILFHLTFFLSFLLGIRGQWAVGRPPPERPDPLKLFSSRSSYPSNGKLIKTYLAGQDDDALCPLCLIWWH